MTYNTRNGKRETATNRQHADQPPGRNRQLQRQLRDTLNHLVVVTHNAQAAATSVISEAVDNVLNHIAAT